MRLEQVKRHGSSGMIAASLAAIGIFAVAGTSAAAEGEFKRHLPGVFIGATSGGGETDYTLGLEYEYRATQFLGVGVVAEHTPGRHYGDGVSVLLGAVHLHPVGDLRLSAGYGLEDVHDSKAIRASGKPPAKTEDVFRLGAAYDFHVGEFGIAPSVNVDFVAGKSVAVFGVAFLRPF